MGTPATQQEQYETQQKLIESLTRENRLLREQLEILKKGLFGKKSERIDPDQLALFLSGEEVPVDEAAAVEAPKKKAKRAAGNGRGAFAEHLARETVEIEIPEEDRACPECGECMSEIGQEVSERGHFVPAQMVVRRYVKKKYACAKGHGVKTAGAPPALIERAKYEPSTSRRSTPTS